MSEQRVHRSGSCWCGHGAASHQGPACFACDRPQVDDRPMPMLVTERRRFDRFALSHPVRTSVGSSPAYVIDASISGIGVLQHAETTPPVGAKCRLMFHSDFGAITLECEIVRTSADPNNGGTFQTGLRIVAAQDDSEARLRNLVMALAIPRSNGH